MEGDRSFIIFPQRTCAYKLREGHTLDDEIYYLLDYRGLKVHSEMVLALPDDFILELCLQHHSMGKNYDYPQWRAELGEGPAHIYLVNNINATGAINAVLADVMGDLDNPQHGTVRRKFRTKDNYLIAYYLDLKDQNVIGRFIKALVNAYGSLYDIRSLAGDWIAQS
jgi:hypothetical protein